jgi:hypothetical protein
MKKLFYKKEEPTFLVNEFQSHQNYTHLGVNNGNDFLRTFCELILNLEIFPMTLEKFNQEIKSEGGEGTKKGKLGIRVDCCGTLSAALQNALVYTQFGIKATFFINHNSNYFKITKTGETTKIFMPRTAEEIIKRIAGLGHEIGLHNDVLYYISTGADPETIMGVTLKKLSQLSGKKIIGTSAHNSAWVYGYENFEVFQEFLFESSSLLSAPLNMTKFGLSYEANFPKKAELSSNRNRHLLTDSYGSDPIRNKAFLNEYFLNHPHFERGYDYEAWLLGRDSWVFVDYLSGTLIYPETTINLTHLLDRRREQNGIVLIHPEYVSADVDEKAFTDIL